MISSPRSLISFVAAIDYTFILSCLNPLSQYRMACRVVSIGLSGVCLLINVPRQSLTFLRAGDHAVSRAAFHILIALCAGPRFLVLILQWLSHRHTASTTISQTSQDQSSGRSTATVTRSKAEHRKPEEVFDKVTGTVRTVVEGHAALPPPPLADIEFVIGIARTFCW
jgi:hypothetical protein